MPNKYDIPATGEYAGLRKLMNHELADYFDIYFSFRVCGGNFSYEVKTVQIKPLDDWEELTPKIAERAVKRIAERYIERTYEPVERYSAKWIERWLSAD